MIASAMEDTSTASYHCGVGPGLLGLLGLLVKILDKMKRIDLN